MSQIFSWRRSAQESTARHIARDAQASVGAIDPLVSKYLSNNDRLDVRQAMHVAVKLAARPHTKQLGTDLAAYVGRATRHDLGAWIHAKNAVKEHYQARADARGMRAFAAVASAVLPLTVLGAPLLFWTIPAALRGHHAAQRISILRQFATPDGVWDTTDQSGVNAIVAAGKEAYDDKDYEAAWQHLQAAFPKGVRDTLDPNDLSTHATAMTATRQFLRGLPQHTADQKLAAKNYGEALLFAGLTLHHLAADAHDDKTRLTLEELALQHYALLEEAPHCLFRASRSAPGYNSACSLARMGQPQRAFKALRSSLAVSLTQLEKKLANGTKRPGSITEIVSDLSDTRWGMDRMLVDGKSYFDADFDAVEKAYPHAWQQVVSALANLVDAWDDVPTRQRLAAVTAVKAALQFKDT